MHSSPGSRRSVVVLYRMAMLEGSPSADPRARRAGFAVVVAVAVVGMSTLALVGFSGATAPRLVMIEAPTSTLPAPTAMIAEADSNAAPTPTATETASGSSRPGVPSNASPPGHWQYAENGGPKFGIAGSLYTFRVAVESGLPVLVPEFTAVVDGALGDYRSWAGAGSV